MWREGERGVSLYCDTTSRSSPGVYRGESSTGPEPSGANLGRILSRTPTVRTLRCTPGTGRPKSRSCRELSTPRRWTRSAPGGDSSGPSDRPVSYTSRRHSRPDPVPVLLSSLRWYLSSPGAGVTSTSLPDLPNSRFEPRSTRLRTPKHRSHTRRRTGRWRVTEERETPRNRDK